MKIASCSECFGTFPIKFTAVIEGKRVCGDCKAKKKQGKIQ